MPDRHLPFWPRGLLIVTAQEIVGWARGQMAAYKAPRIVEFVDALPKSGTGKVQWRVLQDAEMATPAA